MAFPTNLAPMGLYFDPNLNLYVGGSEYANRDNFTRHQARAQVSQYFDVGKTGYDGSYAWHTFTGDMTLDIELRRH